MTERFILRTKSNLSFAGEYCSNNISGQSADGILIKPSNNSGIMIWCPINEVQSVIFPDGIVLEGDDLLKKFNIG